MNNQFWIKPIYATEDDEYNGNVKHYEVRDIFDPNTVIAFAASERIACQIIEDME